VQEAALETCQRLRADSVGGSGRILVVTVLVDGRLSLLVYNDMPPFLWIGKPYKVSANVWNVRAAYFLYLLSGLDKTHVREVAKYVP
jgi:hypothetical protein